MELTLASFEEITDELKARYETLVVCVESDKGEHIIGTDIRGVGDPIRQLGLIAILQSRTLQSFNETLVGE